MHLQLQSFFGAAVKLVKNMMIMRNDDAEEREFEKESARVERVCLMRPCSFVLRAREASTIKDLSMPDEILKVLETVLKSNNGLLKKFFLAHLNLFCLQPKKGSSFLPTQRVNNA